MGKSKIAKKRITSMILALVMLFTISIPAMATQQGDPTTSISLAGDITAVSGEDITGISINKLGKIYLVKSGQTGINIQAIEDLVDNREATETPVAANNSTALISTKGLTQGIYKIYAKANTNTQLVVSSKTVTITSCFSNGDGTEADPYWITSAGDLKKISPFGNVFFTLRNDIDLSSVANWVPLVGWGINFEGNYHVINGLKTDTSDEDYLTTGFFSYLVNSTVKHLGIIEANVKGDELVGILSGIVINSHIEEVYTTGTATGNNGVGGLIGDYGLAPGTVLNCYSLATVKGHANLGGLVGIMGSSVLKTSYSAGQVIFDDSNGDIKENIGGLLGNDVFEDIENSVPNTFLSNYYDTEASGQSDTTGATGITGKTTAQMRTKATFLAGTGEEIWNFDKVWGISSTYNNGYPYLKGFHQNVKAIESKTAIVATVEGVNGTTFDPSIVLSIEDITKKITDDKKKTFNSGIKLVSQGAELKQLFDIKLLIDGLPVQPDGSVTVKIKLTPEMLAIENLQIVYINEADVSVIIPSKIVDDYLIFTTNHFSDYAIIGKIVTPVVASVAPNPKTSENAMPYVLELIGICSLITLAIFKSKKKV